MQDTQTTRRLAAVLFADIVGYSTLTSADEELALRMVRIFEDVSKRTADAQSGRVVKFIGDAVLAEFPSSAAAAEAAIELQAQFQAETEAIGAGRKLRVGLHMGDVVPSADGDLFGEGVNLAARLEQACTPGELLASDVFYRQLRARKEFQFVTRGTRELKGFTEPEPVWALGRPGTVAETAPAAPAKKASLFDELKRRKVLRVAGFYLAGSWVLIEATDVIGGIIEAPDWTSRVVLALLALGFPVALSLSWVFDITPEGLRRTGVADAKSAIVSRPKAVAWTAATALIAVVGFGAYAQMGFPGLAGAGGTQGVAVLPFETAPEDAYFANGISEELVAAFSKLQNLRVPAWASSRQFQATDPPEEVAQRLQVRHILTGSVRKQRNTVKISASLVNTADLTNAWTSSWTRDLSDIFSVQEEIARAIAQQLQVTLSGDGSTAMVRQGTRNLEAYDIYLRGREAWSKRDGASLLQAVQLFEQAAEIDPQFGRAFASAAETYVILAEYEAAPPEEAFPKAREAARRALEIDPALVEAYAALGKIHWVFREWDEAETNFRKALEADPNYATANQWYGWHLAAVGRIDEAVGAMQKAVNSDPLTPILNENLGYVLHLNRQFPEAIAQERRALELDPGFMVAYVGLGRALMAAGDCEEALQTADRLRALPGNKSSAYRLGEVAHVYAGCGRQAAARPILTELEARSPGRPPLPSLLALSYIKLGQVDKALELLQIAVAQDDIILPYIVPGDPSLDPIRSHPGFHGLLRTLGLGPNAGRPVTTAGFRLAF